MKHLISRLMAIIIMVTILAKVTSYYGQTVYHDRLIEGNSSNASLVSGFGLLGMHIFSFLIIMLQGSVLSLVGWQLRKLSSRCRLAKFGLYIVIILMLILMVVCVIDLSNNLLLLYQVSGGL